MRRIKKTLTVLVLTTVVLNGIPTTATAHQSPAVTVEDAYTVRWLDYGHFEARSGMKPEKELKIGIFDSKRRLVPTATSAVTMTIDKGTLTGNTTVVADRGIATFSDLVITGKKGIHVLSFSLLNGKSVNVTVILLPGVDATSLVIEGVPNQIISGETLKDPISVHGVDPAGNKVDQFIEDRTLNVSSGFLVGRKNTNKFMEKTKFSGLTFVGAGNVTLTATSQSGITGSFAITVLPGCPEGGTCVLGNIGPGGGLVYYVASSFFSSPGSKCADTCKHLELAPNNWDESKNCQIFLLDPLCIFSSKRNDNFGSQTSTSVGSGLTNSNTLKRRVELAEDKKIVDRTAVFRAMTYRGGNFTDWYLPSKDELGLISAYTLGIKSSQWKYSPFYSHCPMWSSSYWGEGRFWSRTLRATKFITGSAGRRKSRIVVGSLVSGLLCVRPVRSF